jgi:hypothetical protein
MYTNIDTNTGLNAIEKFINSNRNQLPTNFPTELFLETLKLVMNNNIFTFGDSYWIQLSGTAMGTPVACAYATVSFGYFENTEILTEFEPNLLYYQWYVDDIFGIWLPLSQNKESTWTAFTNTLNDWGSLQWITEKPSKSSTFLDLNISIQNSRIMMTTF